MLFVSKSMMVSNWVVMDWVAVTVSTFVDDIMTLYVNRHLLHYGPDNWFLNGHVFNNNLLNRYRNFLYDSPHNFLWYVFDNDFLDRDVFDNRNVFYHWYLNVFYNLNGDLHVFNNGVRLGDRNVFNNFHGNFDMFYHWVWLWNRNMFYMMHWHLNGLDNWVRLGYRNMFRMVDWVRFWYGHMFYNRIWLRFDNCFVHGVRFWYRYWMRNMFYNRIRMRYGYGHWTMYGYMVMMSVIVAFTVTEFFAFTMGFGSYG